MSTRTKTMRTYEQVKTTTGNAYIKRAVPLPPQYSLQQCKLCRQAMYVGVGQIQNYHNTEAQPCKKLSKGPKSEARAYLERLVRNRREADLLTKQPQHASI